jgi:acyl carrier protein
MERPEIEAEVLRVLTEEFELEAFGPTSDSHLGEDLDLDSLDIVDLWTTLEQVFDLRLDEEQFISDMTVSDLVDYLVTELA